MSEFLNSIGSFFGSGAGKGIETLAGLGATGSGLVGNIMADKQRQDAANAAKANMNLSPAQLGSMVSSATQPLNANLVQAITGQTNANLAEQGLSEAPGLIATATSQALAPFEQQNQQTALQLVMQKLGLPQSFAATIPPNANLSQLIALLMKGNTPTPFQGFQNLPVGPYPQVPTQDTSSAPNYDFNSFISQDTGGQ